MATPTEMCFTDNFIEALLRDSFLPAVQHQYTHQQLLDLAREECVTRIMSIVMRAKANHYVEREDITLVADDARYDLPERAMYDKIRRARLVDSNGKLHRIHLAGAMDLDMVESTTSGSPRWLSFEGNELVFNCPPSSTFITTYPTLRVWLYRRPGKFVRATSDQANDGRCAQIDSIVGTTVTYTDDVPINAPYDVYRGIYPFKRIATAISPTAYPASNQHTFSAADVALLQENDWICVQNETCFMPGPDEIIPHVKSMVIRALSGAQGDFAKYDREMQTLAIAAANELQQVGDRFDGDARRVSLRHSPFVGGSGKRTSFTEDEW